jgi:hypothetical protein
VKKTLPLVRETICKSINDEKSGIICSLILWIEIVAGAAQARRDYLCGDRDKAGSELRYWSARRASAQLVETKPNVDLVQFGSTVTIVRDDTREQTYKIVGEDEADPSQGTISHVSPPSRVIARAEGGRCGQGRAR